jgi:hypothetical protein
MCNLILCLGRKRKGKDKEKKENKGDGCGYKRNYRSESLSNLQASILALPE